MGWERSQGGGKEEGRGAKGEGRERRDEEEESGWEGKGAKGGEWREGEFW